MGSEASRPAMVPMRMIRPFGAAAAMLAGILLRYSLGVPGAALAMPYIILPLIAALFALRLSFPLFAVPVIVALESVLVTFR